MDANQYYQNLLQQGHSQVDAAHFTSQYYPGFQPPMQGAGMMAPPPGGMEFGMAAPAMGAPGMGASAGVSAGMAATGAAAGGGMSVATIAVVSVLVLGGAGTAGYFIYDYLTEPDFYGELYWTEMGIGYVFEEDSMSLIYPAVDGSCDGMWGEMGDVEEKDGLCYADSFYDSYEVEDKGDYYKICLAEDDDDETDCIRVYPLDRGAVMKNSGECIVLVSDIETPNFSDETEEEYEEMMDWIDDFGKVAKEIKKEGPDNCEYESMYAEESTSGSLDMYLFDSRDASGVMSDSGNDRLVHIKMTQGRSLSWSQLKVTIVVDGGQSLNCVDESKDTSDAACTYAKDTDDSDWDVAEEITISEGDYDLCDASNGGCNVDVSITKLGVGNEDDMVIYTIYSYAEA